MKLFVLGYPADCGGANVELFATVILWRFHGLHVVLIPTWSVDKQWQKRLGTIGCPTHTATAKTLRLPEGSTVVSFGNHRILQLADELHHQGCRLIYVPCMSTPYSHDTKFHEAGGQCDEYVFQSSYQYMQYTDLLADVPDSRRHLIPGAFHPADFPFKPRPHKPGEPFWAGRISRPDPLKFSPKLWDAYRPVPNIRARIMGWSGPIQSHCGGDVPCWATVLKKRTEPTAEFYPHLHAIIHPSGEASENWPRFVLEAMAAGVPVITDNRGGVCEMIEHGRTGFLCDTPEDMASAARGLAADESYRMDIAEQAREAVKGLSDPDYIWDKWSELFSDRGK